MSALLAGCLLLQIAAHDAGALNSASLKVAGFVLVSSRDQVIRDASRNFRNGDTLADLEKRYPGPRYKVEAGTRQVAIIIDTESGMIGKSNLQVKALAAILDGAAADLTFKVGDKSAVAELISSFKRPETLTKPISQLTVGLEVSSDFWVEKDGRRLRIQIPNGNPTTTARDKKLESDPVANKVLTTEQYAELDKRYGATPSTENEVSIHFIHVAGPVQREMFDAASKSVKDLLAQLDGQADKTASELLRKFGLNGPALGAGAVEFKDLPESVRKAMLQNVASNYKSLGFDNPADAESFLLNAGSINPTTSIGIMLCEQTGGGGRTPGFGTYYFLTRKGGIAP